MDARVGLLSDSHGRAERTERAVDALLAAGADMLIHAGDIETDAVLDCLAGHSAHLVWGNCDWERASLERYARDIGIGVHGDAGEVEVDGRRIAFTHGHIPAAMRAAMASGAAYLVHGHTHERRDEAIDGVRIINPGALHRARPFTVALLTPRTGEITWIEVP
jgi:putative phosphoesterase